MAVNKKGLGFSLFDFLNIVIEDYKSLIRLVRLLEGLKQAYWHTSDS